MALHTPESTTHWACQKRMDEEGGQARCCGCVSHEGCAHKIFPIKSAQIHVQSTDRSPEIGDISQ